MCFSATASFTASFTLIGAGIYCLNIARGLEKPYWLLALVPLLFGLQQFLEGIVWLNGVAQCTNSARSPALGYLFFSHLFWLFWIPLSCYAVESNLIKRQIFLALTFAGALYGLSMYTPLLFTEGWMTVVLTEKSIIYKTVLLHDQYIPRKLLTLIYILIIISPLSAASDPYLNHFGFLVLGAVVVTALFFNYAFISKWCYFSAVFSLFIVYIFFRKKAAANKIISLPD